jgi:hypothetical protein
MEGDARVVNSSLPTNKHCTGFFGSPVVGEPSYHQAGRGSLPKVNYESILRRAFQFVLNLSCNRSKDRPIPSANDKIEYLNTKIVSLEPASRSL